MKSKFQKECDSLIKEANKVIKEAHRKGYAKPKKPAIRKPRDLSDKDGDMLCRFNKDLDGEFLNIDVNKTFDFEFSSEVKELKALAKWINNAIDYIEHTNRKTK